MANTIRSTGRAVLFLAALTGFPLAVRAQAHITSPKEQWGWSVGDDYRLATYTQLTEYWKKLDAESDRMKLVSIGKTAEGRDQWMAIITSAANFEKLDRYRDIAARLARADGLTDEQAQTLAKEGKSVVWIDGGLHATEVLGSHQLIEHVYRMLSQNDEETRRILDDVIQLVVHANPDGMELVSGWYMRRSEESTRALSGLPRLYQKYIGHDNNRDHYMNAMPESKNMSRVMYREWYPEIMYNHHQTGPAGSVMFAPPFRDPHNYQMDPILVSSLSVVGTAMHQRFAVEGKPGVVQREAASYQTWWNGGLRTTAYFHNIIGILTEAIGDPTPIDIPLVPARLVPNSNDPYPIMPQRWHFRQSIEYDLTANRAILDYASRYREHLLYDIYLMGRNAIKRGSQDNWTLIPSRVDQLRAEAAKDQGSTVTSGFGERSLNGKYFELLRKPADRDPRGYIIPADQADFLTATKFVNALIESGVEVQYATQPFSAAGKQYPAGSYVIKSAQAFRAHVLDLMEPQDYPNDIPYPGGPPKAPYDNAGYTLALQMGVGFDRMLDGFDCPCAKIADVLAKPPVAASMPAAKSGYVLSRKVNDSYLAVNRLLAAKQVVAASGSSFYVPTTGEATRILRGLVEERGLPVSSAAAAPQPLDPIKPVRVGLWDQYGGSMPSGWIRWLLERYEYPFEIVYPKRLDAGSLNQQFDALIFVDGSIPGPVGGNDVSAYFRSGSQPPPDVPAEYQDRIGRVSVEKTIPVLKTFLEAGGRIVTIGTATALAGHLGLPLRSHLVERTPNGTKPLPQEKFYVPASLLEVSVDSSAQAALGMGSRAIVLFDESPVFRLLPDAAAKGIKAVAWFSSATPLRSGWAWGQTYLEGGVAAAQARVGSGMLYLYGPEITFRSQPHGTYRLLFNGLLGK
ncbi:MAG: M14 metallopeptidase family protein [Gemmatimonadota bacterium]